MGACGLRGCRHPHFGGAPMRLSLATRARTTLIAALLATGLGGGALFAATPAHAAATLLVDDDGVQCPTATFTTINAAVAAASDGSTVQVCAGTYNESVVTSKALIFKGAQAGVDARTGRSDASAESIV